MPRLTDISIARKIQVLVAIAALGIAIVGGASLWANRTLASVTNDLGDTQLPAVRHMALCDMYHDGILACVYRALVVDEAEIPAVVAEVEGFADEFQGHLDALAGLAIDADAHAALEATRPALEAYAEVSVAAVHHVAAGDRAAALAELPRVIALFDELEVANGALGEHIEKDAQAAVGAAHARSNAATWWIGGAILAIAALACIVGHTVARSIVTPLSTAVDVLESGDIGSLAEVRSNDEIGRMARAVEENMERLEANSREIAAQKELADAAARRMEESKRAAEASAQRAEQLAAEAARVAAMVENSPTPMLFVDQSLVVRYRNPAAESALVRIGPPWSAVRENDAPLANFYRHDSGNENFLAQARNLPHAELRAYGKEQVRVALSAMNDPQGRRIGTLVAFDVVTEQIENQRRAEELTAAELRRAQDIEARVARMLDAVDRASRGDLTVSIDTEGGDAIARMAGALDTFVRDLRQSVGRIRKGCETLASSSDRLHTVSERMSNEVLQTADQVGVVASTANHMSSSISTVAESTRGMESAIQEIARSASSVAQVARQAVTTAEQTNSTVVALDASSEEIGQILKTITAIAEQTNLLALNATIEAARAGDMGKGFAVVANEVKELAKETARATTDIASKIEAIQGGSRGAVAAITRIGEIIREIDGLQATIVAAVEEQSATTREISRHVDHASGSTNEISRNMDEVATAARHTTDGARDSLDVAVQVSKLADELLAAVGQFKV
jgi:methyl-accepting chemotaxis protein